MILGLAGEARFGLADEALFRHGKLAAVPGAANIPLVDLVPAAAEQASLISRA